MIVLSLFDGMSCGMLALKRAGIQVDSYFASEIDKYAVQVSKKNWPDIIHIGDVTQVIYKDGVLHTQFGSYETKIDMVIGGSPCFVAGTKIQTDKGFKDIESVVVGDMVLTHTNLYKKVLKTGGDKSKPTILIKAQGMIPTVTTSNHPYYSKSKIGGGYTKPKWKEAGSLVKGDYLAFPINDKNENPLNLTEQECLVLGRYIADGHTRKDYRRELGREKDRHWQLILSVGSEKKDVFEKKYLLKHSLYAHTQSTMRAVFSSKRLVEIAEKYCGVGSSEKQIPQIFLNLPVNLLDKVLEGYSDGDGCFTKNGWQATTVSKVLALSLSQAIAKVKQLGSSVTFCLRPKTTTIQGRVVNQKDTYMVRVCGGNKRLWHIEDGFIWYPVKSIEQTGILQDVFNFEVDCDNSYTANGFVVHNCQSFSVAGDGSGFDGKSGLFFEYLRILREVNPKHFLLENVVMKKQWEDVINSELGVKPIMINSALVSAQNRKRLYWTNIVGVTQPQDKGVLLKDVLQYNAVKDVVKPTERNLRHQVYHDGKSLCCTATMYKGAGNNGMSLIDRGYGLTCLTPIECERLQTLPDDYTSGVSNTQRYKMIGNGWTVDVVAHIFSFIGK